MAVPLWVSTTDDLGATRDRRWFVTFTRPSDHLMGGRTHAICLLLRNSSRRTLPDVPFARHREFVFGQRRNVQ
ncbi:hypothetical protein EVAR_60069_1 [Eumeta japonica]|uniref:Uncharacterized protein n=1 Tax=Eumeta variegata TaxID=151549 RepID=A0A4C1ZN64_EUMVA|nr:hypothetical protein EVAR_60069_1 [Eumeta japonica]